VDAAFDAGVTRLSRSSVCGRGVAAPVQLNEQQRVFRMLTLIRRIWKKKACRYAGVVAAIAHLIFVMVIAQTPAEGSWQWFPVFVLDFPVSWISILLANAGLSPFFAFGLIGTLWWFAVVSVMTYGICHFQRGE
jgi:hypothetical protein